MREEEKERWWICKGRKNFYIKCERACRVKANFEPRGCLWCAVWQEWEEEVKVKKGGEEGRKFY